MTSITDINYDLYGMITPLLLLCISTQWLLWSITGWRESWILPDWPCHSSQTGPVSYMRWPLTGLRRLGFPGIYSHGPSEVRTAVVSEWWIPIWCSWLSRVPLELQERKKEMQLNRHWKLVLAVTNINLLSLWCANRVVNGWFHYKAFILNRT